MAEYTLVQIPREGLATAAPITEAYLDNVVNCSQGAWTAPELTRAAQDDLVQVWAVLDRQLLEVGAIVTELREYPKRKVARIWMAGGDLKACVDMVPELETWARVEGCASLEIQGPPVVMRALFGRGSEYKPVLISYWRDL